ncbi:MAG: glucans biosynthesis glucosyltransferase MdoH [Candidatus Omnitrophica bacterium]|nr:glucans biosynthesis glucosyltransferase MdoH [Candidatus Omnitrophota bacterium]
MIRALKQPPLRRTPMAYRPFSIPVTPRGDGPHGRTLRIRRAVFFILVGVSTFLAGSAFTTIIGADGLTPLAVAIIGIYLFLFGWISFNFWTAILGFLVSLSGKEAALPLFPEVQPIAPETRIALIMPVYNEEMARIYSSLRATYESLKDTGQLERFDIYILSDSVQSEYVLMEETAWSELCRDVDGFGRIFYRRRKLRLHKKSGNVSDFCRRWGSQYKYMIIFDADSLMEGELLVRMANMMEARNDIGILQTAPAAMNQASLVSRLQQFASHVYGPLFFSGLRFWQLDESGYWGHNAIIRMAPFMQYCALPKLPGGPPFGGEILSHDFVEAALMRRAGWGVWLAYELEGSYEELPPNLLEEMERDRRWCQGNIQHLRLMFMEGVAFGHRILFLNGNLFYFSSFMWFLLLLLMTVHSVTNFFHTTAYFIPAERTLFPHWPVQYRFLSIQLLMVTAAFLFIPKVLSVLLIARSPQRAARFGGWGRLFMSVVLETVLSTLLAPLRMLFHAWYVVLNLIGQKLVWKSPVRRSRSTSFVEAFRAFGPGMAGALVWGAIAYVVNKTLFWWIAIIVIPLFLAVPISVFFSYPSLGLLFRQWGLFLTPAEIAPSKALLCFQRFFFKDFR